MSLYLSGTAHNFQTCRVDFSDYPETEYKELWDFEAPLPDVADWEYDEAIRDSTSLLGVRPSEFVETAILIPDPETKTLLPFSFAQRGYLRKVYDNSSTRLLLKTARQSEKSTLLGNRSFALSCLIPHFRTLYVSPSAQQTQEFSKTRLREVLETSPDLRKWFPAKLTDNVFEKKAINRSAITLRYAFLNADRCLAGSMRMQLEDGRAVRIRDLVGTAPRVIAADSNGAAVSAQVTRIWPNGKRPVVRVRTEHPLPIVCTADHRILTARGWICAGELLRGDWVAAPHCGALLKETARTGEDMAWLLGAMVSEGHSRLKKHVTFTNTDPSFIREFYERAARCGVKVGPPITKANKGKPCWTLNPYLSTRLGGGGIDGGKARMWDEGEFGALSSDKKIPTCIVQGTFEEKASFLQALFRGDGWRCLDDKQSRAGYCTASYTLAEGLVHLLWSLGIRCALRTRPPAKKHHEPRHILDFSSWYTEKLVELIGEFRNTPRFDSAGMLKDINDRIPLTYEVLREFLRVNYGLSTHAAWVRCRIQLRAGNRRDSIGRRVLLEIVKKLRTSGVAPLHGGHPDHALEELAAEDRSWVEVQEVEAAGTEEVFDFSVQEDHACALVNGHVVHNCRGLRADLIAIDEFQDILIDNIPVILEAASHSPYKLCCFSGTPKSMDNPIEHFWSTLSTQNEWAVPCERHGVLKDPGSWHWNILGENNIGKQGLICDKCGGPISATHPQAQWVRTGSPDPTLSVYEGFHIPQLMVPWIDWKDLLSKYNDFPRAVFFNECLGLSFDSGQRPLSAEDIRANCDQSQRMTADAVKAWREKMAGIPLYGGIDWGQDSGNSYTVIFVGGYYKGMFRVIFAHRFTGSDMEPRVQMETIIRIIDTFQLQRVGVDYGGGYWPNDELLRKYGSQRIVRFQYSTPNVFMRWDPNLGRYLIHRSEVMSVIFNAIKRANVYRFPSWKDFATPFGADMLAIFSEYNERMHLTQYKKSSNNTDDSFHGLLLMTCVSMLDVPRPDIFVPNMSIDRRLDG